MCGNVMRISPPMNTAHTEVDQFIELLDHSLSA
jgi:4-aminobutyrate aminotransferase-like enzyme